jgi:hypothetical protein
MNILEKIHHDLPAICRTCNLPINACQKQRAKGTCPYELEQKQKRGK